VTATHPIEVTHADRVLFPDDGITKGDLVDYYWRIAEQAMPHVRGRPLALQRFPEGIHREGFFQKDVPQHFPDFIGRVTLAKEGGTTTYAVVENPAALAYLAQQGCITPHAWPSRADRPDRPDRINFDVDPPDDAADVDVALLRHAARTLRRILEELGAPSFVKTTGSRGLHLEVPLERSATFAEARVFARGVAEIVAGRDPERFTVEQRKAKRAGRLYLDTMRNSYAQHAVAPYAVRALPGAPVATPLDWEELGDRRFHPRRYTIRNIFRRLGQKADPWLGMDDQAVRLAGSVQRLQQAHEEMQRARGAHC
jgi:bifunctional non-homologous end joining protein LigD